MTNGNILIHMLTRTLALALALAAGSTIPAFAKPSAIEIANGAIAEFKPATSVERVEISTAEPRHYSYYIYFKSGQGGDSATRTETRKLVTATLRLLVNDGQLPSAATIIVRARGLEEMKGITGRPLVRDYGTTRYDHSTDRLEYKPAQK